MGNHKRIGKYGNFRGQNRRFGKIDEKKMEIKYKNAQAHRDRSLGQ